MKVYEIRPLQWQTSEYTDDPIAYTIPGDLEVHGFGDRWEYQLNDEWHRGSFKTAEECKEAAEEGYRKKIREALVEYDGKIQQPLFEEKAS